jgi:glutamate synthase (ferredoxin)
LHEFIGLGDLFAQADKLMQQGCNILILSDRGITKDKAGIPALLAVAGLHNHLVRKATRTQVSLILESAEPREVHHFSLLIGYGVAAVNPYMAFEAIQHMIDQGWVDVPYEKAVQNYIKAGVKGIVKTMSKMGISTIQSYRGAQIFEAVGLNSEVVDKYFSKTPSRIEGASLDTLAQEVALRHERAFSSPSITDDPVDQGGQYKWRKEGEHHLFNPETVHRLQKAVRTGSYEVFKQYSHSVNEQSEKIATLRGLLDFRFNQEPVPIEEVEPVDSIVKRFKTGAMSYGSISKEAHETLAIAMNRLGGKSNTGEGGEDPERYKPLQNGDSLNSAIKQVASGRFGVTSNYLVNARELQIKMAQGAKPGEGGQLPGTKVYPSIAKVRHSTLSSAHSRFEKRQPPRTHFRQASG